VCIHACDAGCIIQVCQFRLPFFPCQHAGRWCTIWARPCTLPLALWWWGRALSFAWSRRGYANVAGAKWLSEQMCCMYGRLHKMSQHCWQSYRCLGLVVSSHCVVCCAAHFGQGWIKFTPVSCEIKPCLLGWKPNIMPPGGRHSRGLCFGVCTCLALLLGTLCQMIC
jgi:hypothetical protein